MQFRPVKTIKEGGMIDLVRWEYDADKGRGVSTRLGRVSPKWSSVPNTILAKMTDQERADVKAFWEVNHAGRARVDTRNACNIEAAAGAVERAVKADYMDAKIAASLYADMARIVAALKRGGFKPTKLPKGNGVAADVMVEAV